MGDAAQPRYPRVVIDAAPEDADVAASMLFELGASGVEECDEGTLHRASAAGVVTLIGSFESYDEALAAVEALKPRYAPRLDEIVGDGWRDAWKEQFHPFHVSAGIVVCPPWERAPAAAGEKVLELEPGRAFGTGLHATTSLVVAAIERNASLLQGVPVLDVGCGTGILALAALLLGASRARATDNDGDVVEVVRENAQRNGFGDRVEVDTTDVAELQGSWPVVLANIEARVLVGMSASLQRVVEPGGLLVLSGVLDGQRDEVLAAFGAMGLQHVEQRDEWLAIELRKAP